MRYITRSPHPWITLGLLAVYVVTAHFVSSQTLLVITNSLLMVVSGVVGVAFGIQAIRYMRGRDKSFQRLSPDEQARAIHLSYGIGLGWIDTSIWRLFICLWLLSGLRPGLVSNDVFPALYLMCMLGSLYHLTSPGALATTMRGRVIACTVVVGVGFILAAIQIWYTPDLNWLADIIEPWLPR